MSLRRCASHGFNVTEDFRRWPSNRLDSRILQLFNFEGNGVYRTFRKLKVTVDGSVVKLGHDRLIRGSFEIEKEQLLLCGNAAYDAESDEFVIAFDKLIHGSAVDTRSTGLAVPIQFQAAGDNESTAANAVAAAESKLLRWTVTRNPISYDRFCVPARATCIYRSVRPSLERRDSVVFEFGLDVVALSTTFEASPLIRPLPTIMTTALAKGLVESAGNEFLHSQPKSGFVTTNEQKRLLLLLDSDPKVAVLSLVGIWVSGVYGVHHPFVWAACTRYTHARDLKSASPTAFLLIVYDCIAFSPSYYECVVVLEATVRPEPACTTFVARALGVVSECETVVAYTTPKARILIKETERNESVVTPCQRLSFAASPFTSQKALESSQQVPDETPSQEDACGGSIRRSIPPEVRRLLAAQEQQLNDLRRRVDDLTRDKSNGYACERSSSSSSSEGTITTPIAAKVVSSTGTMTSFAFPPLSAVRSPPIVGDDGCRVEEIHDRVPVEGEGDAERSLEYPRETLQQQCSRWTEDGGQSALSSFADLKLDSIASEPSAVEWIPPSWPLFNNLPDPSFESALSCRHSALSRCHEDRTFADGAIPDTTFYDGLLRRIQTILSNQSAYDGTERCGSNVGLAPSVFDSMFLPHLNYISLRLDDDDEICKDWSVQFEVLARKYLVGWRADEPTDLSLDTLHYLRKFRLLR